MITGAGILASGLLLVCVALPSSENPGDDPDRSIAWQRALAWPFALLGGLIAGLGGTLLMETGDPRSVNIIWGCFCLLLLIDLGVIMVRAICVFGSPTDSEDLMTGDLTDEEASYLQRVLTKRRFDDVPFRLDQISLGLVQRGLLELDVTHYLAKWCLTPAGKQALRKRSPNS